MTTSFTVAGAEGHLTAGLYPDRQLGEIFLRLGKQGSTLSGVMDAFSIAVSIGLQYGVPLSTYVEKFTNLRFEPAGMTDDPEIRMAQSMMDYIFRRLALDHLPSAERASMGIFTTAERTTQLDEGTATSATAAPSHMLPTAGPTVLPTRLVHSSAELLEAQQGLILDGPLCMSCGTAMRPSGSCYVCESCGSTSGCS